MRATNKYKHLVSLLGLVTFIILAFGSVNDSSKTTEFKIEKPKTEDDIRNERIEKQFSLWDGSHKNLTTLIKESMNDPDSYKHVETVYWDKGDYLIVRTKFRGKNAFGGVVTNYVTAKIDLDGNIMEIISQEP